VVVVPISPGRHRKRSADATRYAKAAWVALAAIFRGGPVFAENLKETVRTVTLLTGAIAGVGAGFFIADVPGAIIGFFVGGYVGLKVADYVNLLLMPLRDWLLLFLCTATAVVVVLIAK
jgi:hypothetical protein